MNTYEVVRVDEVVVRRSWYDVEARTEKEAIAYCEDNEDFDDSEETDWNHGTPTVEDVIYGFIEFKSKVTVNCTALDKEFAEEAMKKALQTLEGYNDDRGENKFEITLTTINDTFEEEL